MTSKIRIKIANKLRSTISHFAVVEFDVPYSWNCISVALLQVEAVAANPTTNPSNEQYSE